MKYLISLVSTLGVGFTIPINFLILPSVVISITMVWLVTGAILISNITSNKNSLLWFLFFMILFYSFLMKTLFMFYIFFELSLIPILLMIIYWGNQPERLSAGLFFLMYTSMLSVPFLVFALYQNKSFFYLNENKLSSFVTFLVISPFLVKMPVFGFHYWLPKAHVEASTSGSMVLAGVLLKLGGYGVFRLALMFNTNFWKMSSFWLFSSILTAILTLMQSDTKKLVAYSSVTHMTFLMVGLSNNTKALSMILVLVSLAHGWASMGMFMSAGIFSHASSTRLGLLMMSENKFHWSSLMLGVLLVSNASLPPFPSFFPELLMLTNLFFSSLLITFFIFLSLVICYYNLYFFMLLTHKKSLEVKMGSVSHSELLKFNFLIFVTFLSSLWILILS